MKILWEKNALHQLIKIEKFLVEKIGLDEELIIDILIDIRNTPKKLFQFPRMGQLIKNEKNQKIYRILIRDYKLYYKIEEKLIIVLAIIHSKQDIHGKQIKAFED